MIPAPVIATRSRHEAPTPVAVIAGLVPGIHLVALAQWIAGTSPAMTQARSEGVKLDNGGSRPALRRNVK
jgi:hypothetical protein